MGSPKLNNINILQMFMMMGLKCCNTTKIADKAQIMRDIIMNNKKYKKIR